MGHALSGPLDAALQLLDRQIVDQHGRMAGNVDDLELTQWPDGTLAVTGLLVGAAALVKRFSFGSGHAIERGWHHLGEEQADRDVPGRIDIELVRDVSTQVELSVGHEGVVQKAGPTQGDLRRWRLSDLLGSQVEGGERPLRVLDVRLSADGEDPGSRIRVTDLVIGRGRPGANLGYDRHPDQGPWPLNQVFRWLHRHTRVVPLAEVEDIDLDARRVVLRR